MSQTKAELIKGLNINASAPATALNIDSSGRVGIGTSSPSTLLEIKQDQDANTRLRISNATNGSSATAGIHLGPYGGNWYLEALASASFANPLRFTFDGTERFRFTYDGKLGIGTTSPSNTLHVNSGATGTSAKFESTGSGSYLNITNSSGAWSLGATTTNFILENSGGEALRVDSSRRLLVGTSSNTTTAKAEFFNTGTYGVAYQPTIFITNNSSGGTANQNTGLGAIVWATDSNASPVCSIEAIRENPTSGTSSALAFRTGSASGGTERMRISNSGYTSVTTNTFYTGNGSTVPLQVERTATDGDLVQFYQAGALEGGISVSGTTVSYNGAHLSRWSQLPSGQERTEILRGSVLSNLDEMCKWGEEDNEQLNRMKVSDVEGDKNVSGVFQGWDDDDDTYTNDFYCAMTGDFIIRIAGDVTVERGDLLMSAGDGTAKPQDDDIIRSKTIAKVTSTNVSCTYDDGSYCVPCVLMAC